MSERATQLLQLANTQVSDLIDLLSTHAEDTLRLPCPGREALGDGTVAACAAHTADNYLRIAAFVGGQGHAPARPGHRRHASYRIPALFRIGRRAGGHAQDMHRPPASDHTRGMHRPPAGAQDVDLTSLLARLSAARDALGVLGSLTDAQLDAVPPASEMKFCDGQRTFGEIVGSLLKHQSHQLNALNAALA